MVARSTQRINTERAAHCIINALIGSCVIIPASNELKVHFVVNLLKYMELNLILLFQRFKAQFTSLKTFICVRISQPNYCQASLQCSIPLSFVPFNQLNDHLAAAESHSPQITKEVEITAGSNDIEENRVCGFLWLPQPSGSCKRIGFEHSHI